MVKEILYERRTEMPAKKKKKTAKKKTAKRKTAKRK